MAGAHAMSIAHLPPLARWWWSIDRWLLLTAIGLMLAGIFLAMSVSADLTGHAFSFGPAWRHMQFCLVALFLMLMFSLQSETTIRRLGILLAVAGLFALFVLPWLGTNHGKGAIRWFSIAGISVQPVEFLKPGLVVMTAWILSAQNGGAFSFARASWASVPVIIGVLMLVFQPDYGQASLILAVWGALIFTAGAPMWLILSAVCVVVGGGLTAYRLDSHVQGRINAFFSPSDDPTEQVNRAAEAIRQGHIFGVGPGEGVVKGLLPDAHTDFILAVAAEEYGLVITMLIVLAYASLTLRAMWRARAQDSGFARLTGLGLGLLIGMQAFINMGVAAKVLPAKGMTLPLISLGGSSMLAMALSIGFLLAVTRRS